MSLTGPPEWSSSRRKERLSEAYTDIRRKERSDAATQKCDHNGGPDVLVVGGGHAALESVLAAARAGVHAVLITMSPDNIGALSCNPSIGGPGKGHLVSEIDALGGAMGILADEASVQSRMLNESRGPAVQSPRVQLDREEYGRLSREYLNAHGIEIVYDEVIAIENSDRGWLTRLLSGKTIKSHAIVICTGTFLRGSLYRGTDISSGGRADGRASIKLSDSLEKLGFKLFRLKTGTPPRVRKNTVNHQVMEQQCEEDNPPFFSQKSRAFRLPRQACYITRTTEETHRIISENIHNSPAFSGIISGSGPRFCPSFETKVVTFPHRRVHRVFCEPEGANSEEYYLQGLSTAMPEQIQTAMVNTVAGLEEAQITRFGYAVEYDCINPTILNHTLCSRDHEGLFFAGQINGTSGYEEAAIQGLLAGANAAMYVLGREPITIGRHEGYAGILVDDLVKWGCDEPYRMFTSRSEFRIIQRCQNARIRLFGKAGNAGLISRQEMAITERMLADTEKLETYMKKNHISEKQSRIITGSDREVAGSTFFTFAGRPGFKWDMLKNVDGPWQQEASEVLEEIRLRSRYGGYAEKLSRQARALEAAGNRRIPAWVNYHSIPGLSRESRERWSDTRPADLYAAAAMPGITPADLGILLRWINKKR